MCIWGEDSLNITQAVHHRDKVGKKRRLFFVSLMEFSSRGTLPLIFLSFSCSYKSPLTFSGHNWPLCSCCFLSSTSLTHVGGKETYPRPHPPEQKAGNELLKGLNQSQKHDEGHFPHRIPIFDLKKQRANPNTWCMYDSNPYKNLI